MFHFLGFLFIIIIAVLVIGLSVIGTIFKALFGFGRRSASNPNSGARTNAHTSGRQKQSYTSSYSDRSNGTTNEEQVTESNARPHHKKIFSKEDGEYVDFEEIQ